MTTNNQPKATFPRRGILYIAITFVLIFTAMLCYINLADTAAATLGFAALISVANLYRYFLTLRPNRR